jgi:hypothetical protein
MRGQREGVSPSLCSIRKKGLDARVIFFLFGGPSNLKKKRPEWAVRSAAYL